METIQTTAESWRLEETCYYSNSSEKPSVNADGKNSNNKIMKHTGDGDANCGWYTWTISKGWAKEQEELEDKWRPSRLQHY